MRRSSLIGLTPLLLVLAAGAAQAHAFLDHAEPRVGNKVATPPRQVTLWFTQKLEPAFSSVTVTNAPASASTAESPASAAIRCRSRFVREAAAPIT